MPFNQQMSFPWELKLRRFGLCLEYPRCRCVRLSRCTKPRKVGAMCR